MKRQIFICLTAVWLAACTHGTRVSSVPVANSPSGTQVSLRLTGEERDIYGELFAVDDAGLLVNGERLVRVPWTRVHALVVPKFDARFQLARGQQVDAARRQRLALISRFPQGLTGPLLAQVLATLKQDVVEEVQ